MCVAIRTGLRDTCTLLLTSHSDRVEPTSGDTKLRDGPLIDDLLLRLMDGTSVSRCGHGDAQTEMKQVPATLPLWMVHWQSAHP